MPFIRFGGLEMQLYADVTSTRREWSTSRPGPFATGGRAYGTYWMGPRAVEDAVNIIKLTVTAGV